MAEAYDEILSHANRIINVHHVEWYLKWDQEVKMPPGGTPARAAQKSTIATLKHELLTDGDLTDALDRVDESTLTADQQAVVREIRRQHDREKRAPSAVVSEISRLKSESLPAWKRAKRSNDFEIFVPYVEDLVESEREYAQAVDPDLDPFAGSFRRFEPYISIETVDEVLSTLKRELPPLIEKIRRSEVEVASGGRTGTFPQSDQAALVRDVLDLVGFDWEHGRLDTAPHPFASGTPDDARISMRYDENDVIDGVVTALHEFGHANYTLELPSEAYGTPLGEPRDYSIHEGIARFWENHVGRTRAFWERCMPLIEEHFPAVAGLDPEVAYEAANEVFEDNLIRTAADELTYHLHIVVRYEVAKQLLNGSLAVEDIPEVWADKMGTYLGVRPTTDTEGFLQDIHWSHCQFSYFPAYSLGSVFAAQLAEAAEETLDLEALIRAGDFETINEWLTERVHRHGQRYTTDDLIVEATGEPLGAGAFVDYVTEKYSKLYEL